MFQKIKKEFRLNCRSKMKKVMISVGGTGGHVIPAKVLADKLINEGFDCLFVGSGLSTNSYFDQSKYAFKEIVAPPLSLRSPMKSLGVVEGIRQSKKIMELYKPDAVIGFGSYHTVPTLIAAVLRQDPIVLYEANSMPGRVIRLFSSFAKVTTIHMPEAAAHLRGHVMQVDYPLRPEYEQQNESKEEAFKYFGLDPKRLTLLILGGSQGALGINKLIKESIALLQKKIPFFQVIHMTGSLAAKDEFEVLYKRMGIPAAVKDFEKRIDLAWNIATVSITRAGAGSIAEQLSREVPGILIPFPGSKDKHQEKNADFMMWTVGGGIKLLEFKATPLVLLQKLIDLLNPENMKQMKRSIRVYKENLQNEDFTSIVHSIVKDKK